MSPAGISCSIMHHATQQTFNHHRIIPITAHVYGFRVTPVLGYSPQELLGKSAFDFYHPEDQAHMKDSFEQGTVIILASNITTDLYLCGKLSISCSI